MLFVTFVQAFRFLASLGHISFDVNFINCVFCRLGAVFMIPE